MKSGGSSLKHRIRVAKRVLCSRGCEIRKDDNILEVCFPGSICVRQESKIRVESDTGLIDLALQVLRAEKSTGINFKKI